jgi:adenylosuccinate lyase
MLERYSHPEMAQIWTLEAKYHLWLKVELIVLKVHETLGNVPVGTYEDVARKARFHSQRVSEIEAEVKHDVIAFLTNIAESVGENARFIHLGMTSSDLIDTALNLQIQQARPLITSGVSALREAIYARAKEHRYTVMMGRSHGVHGEPITFGAKLLVWVDEISRHEKRLHDAFEEMRVGMISGAMGTYAHLSLDVERHTCEALNLKPVKASTQVIQRDRHAALLNAFALLASSIEKMAVEIRHLQRTDVLEVEEAFSSGQKGSSAMPHKRNPISCENITGLARLIRSYAIPAMENMVLWHERDMSHSSVERVILPDAFTLLHYMLTRFTSVVRELIVYPQNMERNMNIYGGVVFSQRVLLALVEAGMAREEAYALVQRCAHQAWNIVGGDFRANVMADATIHRHISEAALEACFNPAPLLANIDGIFKRFEL